MKCRSRVICVVFAMCLMLVSACTKTERRGAASVIREGSQAPDIGVTSVSDDSVLKLSSLKGKVVLLNFWATWCPPCREEIPSMMKLQKSMTGKPFQMMAVSIDEGGKTAINSFFKESGFSLPTYLDSSGTAQKLYGLTGVPESFIIDKQGVLVKKIIGGLAWDSSEVFSFLEELIKK
ncbi:MAG: TlpA disulfide reductase family protein [Desulfuromonadales bacterium]